MKRKFSYKIRFFDMFLLAIGFALALFDMTLLRDGIHTSMGASPAEAPKLALLLATIANTFALSWGITNGQNPSRKHAVNKKSLFSFLAWLAFGGIYAAIEIMDAQATGDISVVSYLFLAASYISSGIAIQMSASKIWDVDASACRASESEYDQYNKKIAKEDSKINYLLTTLECYNQNYNDLDEQYAKQLEAIHHAEDAVINEILGKTLQENPSITPSEARKVVAEARKDFVSR